MKTINRDLFFGEDIGQVYFETVEIWNPYIGECHASLTQPLL